MSFSGRNPSCIWQIQQVWWRLPDDCQDVVLKRHCLWCRWSWKKNSFHIFNFCLPNIQTPIFTHHNAECSIIQHTSSYHKSRAQRTFGAPWGVAGSVQLGKSRQHFSQRLINWWAIYHRQLCSTVTDWATSATASEVRYYQIWRGRDQFTTDGSGKSHSKQNEHTSETYPCGWRSTLKSVAVREVARSFAECLLATRRVGPTRSSYQRHLLHSSPALMCTTNLCWPFFLLKFLLLWALATIRRSHHRRAHETPRLRDHQGWSWHAVYQIIDIFCCCCLDLHHGRAFAHTDDLHVWYASTARTLQQSSSIFPPLFGKPSRFRQSISTHWDTKIASPKTTAFPPIPTATPRSFPTSSAASWLTEIPWWAMEWLRPDEPVLSNSTRRYSIHPPAAQTFTLRPERARQRNGAFPTNLGLTMEERTDSTIPWTRWPPILHPWKMPRLSGKNGKESQGRSRRPIPSQSRRPTIFRPAKQQTSAPTLPNFLLIHAGACSCQLSFQWVYWTTSWRDQQLILITSRPRHTRTVLYPTTFWLQWWTTAT